MGSIMQKLNHLAETKEELKQALIEMGAEVTDEDTFASYAEKFLDATPDTVYAVKGIETSRFKVYYAGSEYESLYKDAEKMKRTDLIGEYTVGESDFVCPRIKFPNSPDGTLFVFDIPFSPTGKERQYTQTYNINVVDFSTVEFEKDSNVFCHLTLHMIRPGRLIMPKRVQLGSYGFYNCASGTDSFSLLDGLTFAENVCFSSSSWIYRPLSADKRTVKFPEGFKLKYGQVLYLNKICMTQESLQEMVQNLYDYVGTGEEEAGLNRTISLGSTNLALLTDEEKALANAKGWALT